MKRKILLFSPLVSWRCPTFYKNTILIPLLLLTTFLAHAQSVVKGKVTDEAGEAIPGANILIKGTSTGTATDAGGNYSIEVPGNDAILVFSFIGFESEEIVVGTQTTLNISLMPNIESLSEVVVIGYGAQRKEAVTGSVASISGDVMREVPSANITQALQGRMPGVDMTQTSSKPGASMQIRIRGSRSLTASNDPLVVLDGIPFVGSIADINPNEIKSVDILKDASATAIYGSRGANGVILITTNKGQKGQKARINYSGFYGTKEVFGKYPMMNGPEFVQLRKDAGLYPTNGVDEADDVNTDWQDLFYQPGEVMSHDLGLSGGTEKGSYSFGLGYYRDKAVIPTQQYDRYSFRASIDQEVGKYLKVGFNTNNNHSISRGDNVGVYGILNMSPIANPYNPDGTWKRTIRMPADESWLYTRETLKDIKDEWLNETRVFATYNAFYGEVQIPGIEGLKYRANLGLDFRQRNNGAFTGQGIGSSTPTTPSTASVDNQQTYHWLIENLLTYDRTFGEKHNFNVVALYSTEQNKYTRSNMGARDIPSSSFQFYNLGHADGEKTINPGDQDYQLSGLMSWMGRVMYSYDDRYMLSATLRSDASSRLAEGHKWHTYPAISAGWNIKNESFMSNIFFIDKLKIRAGYGQTSNQSVAPYATLGRLSTRPYNFGNDTYATGYYVTELPNDELGWEYSETFNYGLDFAFLNNRLSGTVEYYVTNTKDLLLRVGLPRTSGVNNYVANVGETQNKGIELGLNGIILDDFNGFTWEAGVNFYSNRNELVSLASGQTRDEGNGWFVGHGIDAIYDYEKVGLWQEGDEHLNVLEPGGNVGMIKVKYTGEFKEDGTPARQIGPDDRQVMDIQPDFQGGFNTRLAYKGFDLSVVGAFKKGGILISSLYGGGGYLNLMNGRRGNIKVDYWTPENTDAKYPNPKGLRSGDNLKYANTLGYFDASYLKIRTISLGYNFAQNWIKSTGIDNLRLYFTVQNPFVMFSPYHKESGMDPEPNSYGDENAAVPMGQSMRRILTIGTNTPSTRNYVFGLNLTF